jgi:hypothetical protein
LSNAFTALLGIGVASASTTIPALTPVVAAGLTGLGGGLSSVIGSAINDARADGSVGPTDLSIFQLSDSIATFKKVMLTGLDLGHNATFSNGKAGDHQAPEVSFFDSIY